MRGTVAKALRRVVFGEGSRRPRPVLRATATNRTTLFHDWQSPRARYLALKAAHKER